MGSEADLIAATSAPATSASLREDLRRLGVERGDVIMVHSSLSALGWVAGGAQAMVEALFGAVGSEGTVVMPTQSGQLTDPAGWSNPPVPPSWVDAVREGLPAFDTRLTPTRSMGQVVECFRQHLDTVRSPHPTLSFAAKGPAAREIAAHHPLTPAFGDSSPLGRLYELDAKLVLLGIGHAHNTSLHLAEERATWATKTTRREGAPVLVDGERTWVEWDDTAHDESDFEKIGAAFAATGDEHDGQVGAGAARLCRQRAVVDFGVDWIEQNR